jgi:catechol 2,3-dioxygenase-like lactoylglutathione lyase family enzyme
MILFVKDMGRSIRLFHDILGFDQLWRLPKVGGKKLSAVMGLPEMQAEIAYLQKQAGETAVELVRLLDGSPAPGGRAGGVGLSLAVEDLSGLHRKLVEEGWKPFTEPVKMLGPDGREIEMFCFRTEEGLLVELFEKT